MPPTALVPKYAFNVKLSLYRPGEALTTRGDQYLMRRLPYRDIDPAVADIVVAADTELTHQHRLLVLPGSIAFTIAGKYDIEAPQILGHRRYQTPI